MRTADGPTPSDMNSRSASPPRTTKIGVPHAAATSTKATSGQSAPADNVAGTPDQPRAHDEPARRHGPGRPRGSRAPHRADRNQPEGQRQHRLRHPRGDAGSDDGARLALAHHQLVRAGAEHRRHRGSHGRRQHPGYLTDSTGWQERAGRQRQHRAFARGQRRAEKADPQHQMLDERNGSGNAEAEHPPKHYLGERHDDHHGKRDARHRVLEGIEDAGQGAVRALDSGRDRAAHLAVDRCLR